MLTKIPEYPKVTFALFSYNQELYIKDAVHGALSQDYDNLEIIISDDCSSDSTFEIIQKIISEYTGPNKIVLNKNISNIGLARHFNNIVSISTGSIVIVAAGDDISFPNRTLKTVELLSKYPNAYLVSFSDTRIDSLGGLISDSCNKNLNEISQINIHDYLCGKSPHLSGASRGFKKEIYSIFGPLIESCPTEDTPYLLRSLMLGDAILSPDTVILYREHGNNLSGPQSLPFLPIEKIRDQYISDAKRAKEKDIINSSVQALIDKWAIGDYKKRSVFNGFFRSTNKIFYFICKVFFSSDVSFMDKKYMLSKIIQIFLSRGG